MKGKMTAREGGGGEKEEHEEKPVSAKTPSPRPRDVANNHHDDDFEHMAAEILVYETKPAPSPPPPSTGKRPQLKLKLENMPTPQEAEKRAQRAASRLIARTEAAEFEASKIDGHAPIRLRLASCSSDTEVQSPDARLSSSQWSPGHGRFTTHTVSVSEAGISSPDSAYLNLQLDLARVREVGRGASGVVHKAIHIPTLNVVAVKDIPVYGKGQRRQMVRELNSLYANLVPISGGEGKTPPSKKKISPFIVSFYDAFVDKSKNTVSLVMQYMDMGSLQDLVLRGGCSNETVLARMSFCIVKALSHIHANRMVHRDIKPHNLLMNRFGQVKISDFGLAKTLNDNTTKTKTFVGTLLYMAPERIGGGDYSYAADVWSFGLSLVAVALGKYPLPTQDGFFGLVDSVANHEEYLALPEHAFSEHCRSFFAACLDIDPETRATANELLFHPFITQHTRDDYLPDWHELTTSLALLEDPKTEVEDLGDAVYRHIYQHSVQFSAQTQSEFGHGLISRRLSTKRQNADIKAVEKSLQLGLAKALNVPTELVYTIFEKKRLVYASKLREAQCFSPQSWAASPGYSRRQQFLGSDGSDDTDDPIRPSSSSSQRHRSIWRRFRDKFKGKARTPKTVGTLL